MSRHLSCLSPHLSWYLLTVFFFPRRPFHLPLLVFLSFFSSAPVSIPPTSPVLPVVFLLFPLPGRSVSYHYPLFPLLLRHLPLQVCPVPTSTVGVSSLRNNVWHHNRLVCSPQMIHQLHYFISPIAMVTFRWLTYRTGRGPLGCRPMRRPMLEWAGSGQRYIPDRIILGIFTSETFLKVFFVSLIKLICSEY